MAGELTLDRQIEWAEEAVSGAKLEIGQILDQLAGDVQSVSRRYGHDGSIAGNAPTALGGLVNQLDRWRVLLTERETRLRTLRSWREGS